MPIPQSGSGIFFLCGLRVSARQLLFRLADSLLRLGFRGEWRRRQARLVVEIRSLRIT